MVRAWSAMARDSLTNPPSRISRELGILWYSQIYQRPSSLPVISFLIKLRICISRPTWSGPQWKQPNEDLLLPNVASFPNHLFHQDGQFYSSSGRLKSEHLSSTSALGHWTLAESCFQGPLSVSSGSSSSLFKTRALDCLPYSSDANSSILN